MAKVRLLDPTDSKRRLDRYELIGELASGGMATVFLGRLGGVGGFQRFVAIKRLHPHLASEEEFIEMFLDEARLAAGIHHPHVVPILEVGESDSGYYLVMEYIEGDTLARLTARGMARANPPPRPVLIRILLDTLSGLHAAHELVDPTGAPVHLVHRDVSPQNILVGVDGCSRITDFGVAHAASRLSNTRSDKLKGKLAYMSPEQAHASEIDRRSDVFAMGIILWEVLSLKRLFRAETEALTLQRVAQEPIPRLSAVVSCMHPALDQVCAKALERDPQRRYKSAAEMAEALERAGRAAASASATDLGVASPREVAAYVQGALGEDIAAQRESVRAWLAHSELSLPRYASTRPERADVTFRMPLDRGPEPEPSTVDVDPHAVTSTRGSALVAARAAQAPTRVESADHDGPASSPKSRRSPSTLPSLVPVEPAPSEDEEGETLLMDREAQGAAMDAFLTARKGAAAAPPSVAPPISTSRLSDEGTASVSVTMMSEARKSSRAARIAALLVALLVVIGGLAVWWQMRASTVAGPAVPRPAPSPTPAVAVSSVAAESAAPQPAPEPKRESEATPINALPNATPAPKGHPITMGPQAAPNPVPAQIAKGKPAEPARPAEPAKPPEPTKPPDDMANPYR